MSMEQTHPMTEPESTSHDVFTPDELARVEELRSHYPTPLGAVMGVLHMVQRKFGFISNERIQAVAELLGIPAESVLGVVTFYEMYHQHPLGTHHLMVCTNVSCLLRGSDAVLAVIRERLGLENGGVTEDGAFSLHEVECLGSCGTAPMLSVHDRFHENLTPEKVHALIDELLAMEGSPA